MKVVALLALVSLAYADVASETYATSGDMPTDCVSSMVYVSSFREPTWRRRTIYCLQNDGRIRWGYTDSAFAVRKYVRVDRVMRSRTYRAQMKTWREMRGLLRECKAALLVRN